MQTNVLLGQAHFGGESGVRNPLRRVASIGLLEHAVDLLQRETLGLRDEEVGESQGEEAKGSPHKEDLTAKIGVVLARTDEVGSDDTDDLRMLKL